ncbi:ABC transporter permease [Actinomyces culturomici]|uniref:ABC transporter permease n=1 Tax=Actinomyces culturomici TaxID=1926276 RepID=UPI000E2030E9|nr:ABC transporter permease [Actinomyces culturomici]
MASPDDNGFPSERRRLVDLTLRLTQRTVSSEFKGTALGRLWSFINPLATVAVFALIFGVVFRGSVDPGRNSGIDSFALWIGIGVICWSFLSGAILSGMSSLIDNAGLLTKVYFPREALIYSTVLAMAVDFIFELIVLVIISALMGGPGVFAMIPALLVVMVLTAFFSTGVSLVLSIATVYFRDIAHLWSIFNQIWMYASGVVFSLGMLHDVENVLLRKGWSFNGGPIPLTTIFRLNPAETFLEAYRSCLYDFALPSLPVTAACVFWSFAAFGFGTWFFKRHSPRIVEEL